MGFNCAAEKAKFDREWAKLRKEYANAGMSEKSIQKIYEYDWHCFCRNRAYERRATKMPSIEIDGPDDDRRSALLCRKYASGNCRKERLARSCRIANATGRRKTSRRLLCSVSISEKGSLWML